MKRWVSIVWMLLAVTVVAPLATGEKSTKPNKDKKTAVKTKKNTTQPKKDQNDSSEEDKKLVKQLKQHFAELAGQVQLNTKQLEHLIKLQKDQEAKFKEWDKKNEKKIAELKKKLDASQKPEEQKSLRGQLDKLDDQRRKIVSPFDAKAEKILNKKQKNQWDTHKLYYVAKERYAIYELDEEQLKKLEVACSRLVRGVDTSKKLVRHARKTGQWLLKDKQMGHNLDRYVYKRIFNKEQQKAFRQMKKQEEMQKKLREEEKKKKKKRRQSR